jgi:uncharacterized membrane protein YidH (DUF202 family)
VSGPARPDESFDRGLQHERTALAWERTAIALMIAGLVLSRAAALEEQWVVAAVGLLLTVFGGSVLIWAGVHYEDLHGPLRRGDDVVHPLAARLVGLATVGASGLGLAFAVGTTVLG